MDLLEHKIIDTIDNFADSIIKIAEDIYHHPENGYHEFRTSGVIKDFFHSLGLVSKPLPAPNGICAELKPSKPHNNSIHLAVLAELDGILCPDHPDADKNTGIAHACGHHAQLAALAGTAAALSDPFLLENLGGSITLMAVPAEEYVSVQTRESLFHSGEIKHSGSGKSELICNGAFDSIDLALSTHVHMYPSDSDLLLGNVAANGFLSKRISISGKAAHAGIAPWEGINALNIATSALSMEGLLRETFPEEDHIRVHGVIGQGGGAINVVPDHVVVEQMIRAASQDAIQKTSNKVDRIFKGAAFAFEGSASIVDYQGYLPVRNDYEVIKNSSKVPPTLTLLKETACLLSQDASYGLVRCEYHNSASTDLGDLTHIMPIVNFTHGGCTGSLHSRDFSVADPYQAYVIPSKMMALTAYKLLKNQARAAHQLIDQFIPAMTIEEYKQYVAGFKTGVEQ